jgi:hypothetical protein
MECKRCGYIWTPKVDKPEFCPKCKQPRYDIPSYKKKIEAYEDAHTIIPVDNVDEVITNIKESDKKSVKFY